MLLSTRAIRPWMPAFAGMTKRLGLNTPTYQPGTSAQMHSDESRRRGDACRKTDAVHLTLDTPASLSSSSRAGRDPCRGLGTGPLLSARGRLRRCDVICGAIFELGHSRPVNRPIASSH